MPESLNPDLETCHVKGDQLTKQIVVATICGIAWTFTITACVLALRQIPIPPEIKELTLFILGVISGSLIKTGVDRLLPSGTPADPIVTETTGPNKGAVEVTETQNKEVI